MVNFPNDIELEEDYEMGWCWPEVDTGPAIAPYSGFRQCLLDPTQNKPEHFLEALFDRQMYTIMAEETDMHKKKIQGKFFSRSFFLFLR